MRLAFAALSGVVFGAGLAVSQMTNPAKVLSFLDVAGAWDPSLAFVMAGAVAVSGLAYAVARCRSTTWLGGAFHVPTVSGVDFRLLAGATLFGAGWGLAGFCPGPAIAASVAGAPPVWIFLGALVVGTDVFRLAERARSLRGFSEEEPT